MLSSSLQRRSRNRMPMLSWSETDNSCVAVNGNCVTDALSWVPGMESCDKRRVPLKCSIHELNGKFETTRCTHNTEESSSWDVKMQFAIPSSTVMAGVCF